MKTVTFYTKADCGLCQKEQAILQAVAQQVAFEWVTVDITEDEAAFRRYCIDIPVILIDGEEHARHRLDAEAFKRALKA